MLSYFLLCCIAQKLPSLGSHSPLKPYRSLSNFCSMHPRKSLPGLKCLQIFSRNVYPFVSRACDCSALLKRFS